MRIFYLFSYQWHIQFKHNYQEDRKESKRIFVFKIPLKIRFPNKRLTLICAGISVKVSHILKIRQPATRLQYLYP